MVLPNKFNYPMISDLKSSLIKFIKPLGLLRLEVIEARHLKKADVGMLGLGKSDPYVNIIIGKDEFKTPTIFNTVNPKWNYVCETLAFFATQSIDLEVMDEDQGSKDDFLGRISFPIETIVKDGMIDAWVNLKDTKVGRIHVKATWFNIEHSMDHLEAQKEECKEVKQLYQSANIKHPYGSVATLMIYLDCIKNLPLLAKSIGEPSPQVVFKLGDKIEKSIVKTFTTNPVWEENFSFLIENFDIEDELYIDVFDTKTNRKIGDTTLKLKTLTELNNMTHSKPIVIRSYNYSFEMISTISLWFFVSPAVKTAKMVRDDTVESIDEPVDNLPAMEDFVKGTVEPIAKIGGLNTDIIELSQKHHHQQER